jgi:nifR3 family TIM-barrel protein
LAEPRLAASLVEAARKGCDVPVSIKMRIGIEAPDEKCIEFAQMMESAGAAFITVHGRAREQFYSGTANYDMIRRIKERVCVPVIANGDVTDGASAKRILLETGADGIALARGALGAPDVFARIKAALNGEEECPLSLEARFEVCLKHLSYAIEDKGEERACVEFRKHMLWYLKGIEGANGFKVEAGKISSVNDCKALIDKVLKQKK